MTRIVLLIILLLPFIAKAATTTVYDFNVRSPGVNAFAYEGISLTQIPTNNTLPSSEHTPAKYTAIATNDGSASAVSTTTNNAYPSIRYVFGVDEDIRNVSELTFLWNGLASNNHASHGSGAKIYIWNFTSNGYVLATSTTVASEVDLTFTVTSNPSDYIDKVNNRIIIYIVSQGSTFSNKTNQILTDYVSLTVASEVPPLASLVANFQFDECEYSGSGNEVIDQLGRYSATSYNSVNTSSDAKLVKALGINNAQQHIQTNIVLPASYSVSTWFKKPSDNLGNPYFVLGAMESGGDLLVLERDNNWRWAIYDTSSGSPIILRGNYSFSGLDDNWHHMTLVYHANQTSLYIDGRYVETIGLAPSGTLKYIGTSFDDFATATPQGFRAPLDEFMVFNGVLSDSEIAEIYSQQNSGKNFDGTPRVETPCATALANFQFDECGYYGIGNEVLDQLGNYSATSHNGVTTSADAQMEKALAITSAQQHVQTLIALPASYSVSTWFKKPTDTSGNPFFILGSMENGGDLLFLDRANAWRWGIYDSSSQTSTLGTYSFNNLDNNWHHMVLLYQNNQSHLYIDGVFIESVNLSPSGTLKYIGTSFDDLMSASPQGFRAPLDEFIVFDGVLTLGEISQIYQRQNSGKNYDGSTRTAESCSVVRANYKFDEFEYADVAGEVIDSIGAFHGQAKLAQTVQGKVCRALDLSATGTRNYVELDEAVLHNQSEFSISLWAKTAKTGGQSLLSGATTGSINELMMWFTRDTSFRPYVQDTHNGSLAVASIAGDTWRHLVWTQGNDQSCLFIDTVLQGCLNQTTSLLDIQSLIIGQEQDSVGGGFDSSQAYDGLLDELVIFDGVIDQNKIAQIYNFQNSGLGLNGETIDCPEPPIVRYEIVHDGSGFTCAAEPITIKACTNSMCSRVSTEQVSLNFNITSPTTGVTTKASPTFIGSTRFNFNHRTAETVTLSIDRATIAAQNAPQCSGVGRSCDMTFEKSGYIVTLADHNACTAANLVIQAVTLSDDGVSCAAAYSGDQPVELTFNYQNPSTGTKLPNLAGIAMAANGVPQSRLVSFDASATATLPFEYQDAGQVRISVKDVSALGLASSSVITVVSPEQLIISAPEVNSACLSADPNDVACSKFKVAGENFSLDLTATCADTAITTPNFQLTDIALSLDLIAPANKNLGELGITSVGILAQGKASVTEQNISEVGVFTITATPPINGYFGNTIAATTTGNIGRFVPDNFVVSTVFEGVLENRNGHSFAYSSEMNSADITKGALSYKYLMEPEILITARNKNGVTTQNYTSDFVRLSPASFNIKAPSFDVSRLEKTIDTDVVSNINTLESNITDLGDGTIKYKFSDTDNFVYTKNAKAKIDKYTGKLALQFAAIKDSDDVLATDTDSIIDNGIITLNPEGIEIRFGRWNIENTFGPENADLPLPMSIQYWNGNTFVINELDSLTTFNGGNSMNYTKDNNGLSPKLAASVVDVSGAGPSFFLGRGHLFLARPTDGSRGQIRLTYLNIPSWLRFNWNDIDENLDGDLYDDNPSGIATFGVYRGNDRIISWREVSN